MQQMGMGGNLINLFLEWTVIVPLFLPQNILLLFLHVSLPFNYSLLYRVTRQVEAYILLPSIWGAPLACMGSS